jgi:PQQ-dependent dehydrogenase (methanol/ethanol family)
MKNVIGIVIIVVLAIAVFTIFVDEKDSGGEVEADIPVVDMEQKIRAITATVNKERIMKADEEPGNWLAHGRTYDEKRFSPLTAINDENISELGLAWYFDTQTNRGLEASPIVVDGIMYTTGSWSIVFANDAKTGEPIWQYDPKVPKEWGANACCDVVNRGVALWEGAIYLGTIDGRLVSLDAATGELIWEVSTIDRTRPYTITGAPRIINGKVIIGNGGAEYDVRGYVGAYDAKTGEHLWRFYTVPGNPAEPFESPALEEAAKTWSGGDWWTIGGGGTVWDSMSYDPDLNLLYIGVGNGAPWNRVVRSPGGGDNLYLSSIVALNPDTGEYVWHYQTTPGDSWDYTATQHMILTDLTLNGVNRKVIMQAPKNGFFYVLDRETGEFISAKPYVPITWASHVDPETGKPVETDNARYQIDHPLRSLSPKEQVAQLKAMSPEELEKTLASLLRKPAPYGGHNWHPMTFNPDTGLVYIPALDIPFVYGNETQFNHEPGRWNIGVDPALNAPLPDLDLEASLDATAMGHLIAWDPVKQEEAWRVQHPGPWNGGLLSTAGNLVFQGTSYGQFIAYRADTGEELWRSPAQTGVIAPPISYSVDGEQYIAVVAGWGGAFPLAGGGAAERIKQKSRGKILAFKLGGTKQLPELLPDAPIPDPPPRTASEEEVENGRLVYARYCGVCHGNGVRGGGVLPDLRYMVPEKHLVFEDIVLGGILKDLGMVSFADVISREEARDVQAYIIERAHATRTGN